MNLTDLCPEGLDLLATVKKWENIWARYGSINNLWQIRGNLATANQAYQEHVRDCELCKEE